MLLLGTVVKIIDPTTVKVRIPVMHKTKGAVGATPDSELPIASIATQPGIVPALKIADVVVLAFDRGSYNDPVVVGKLFTQNEKDPSTSSAVLSTLDVTTKVTLPSDTTVGSIKYSEIEQLDNIKENISDALSSIRNSIRSLESHVDNTSVHITDGNISGLKKLTIDKGMYGSKEDMDKLRPVEGQLFFLLEE